MTDTKSGFEIAEPKAKIFISYSRKDMAFAGRPEAALKERGFEPLIDQTEIYAFENWWKRIESLIKRADTVVFVLSPYAVASNVALREVAYAASLNKRFAPIVFRRTDDSAVPDSLRRLNFIFFDDPDRFEAGADQLAEALKSDIGWVRRHTVYGETARRWAAGGHKNGLLLRSPVLEEAERWIASRPQGAPEPTAETRTFVAESRRGATQRRNILTASLAAGLVIALALTGLLYREEQFANQQRQRAEDALTAATKSANSLVFDLATRFEHSVGVPIALIKDVLDRARGLQQQLFNSGQTTPALLASEANALNQLAITLVHMGEAGSGYDRADRARQILEQLISTKPNDAVWQQELSISYERMGLALQWQDKLAEALVAYNKSLEIDQTLAGRDPGNDGLQDRVATELQKIGDASHELKNYDETLRAYQTGLSIWQRLAEKKFGDGTADFNLAVGHRKVAIGHEGVGMGADATADYQLAAASMEELITRDSGNSQWQNELVIVYGRLGELFIKERKNDEALDVTRKCIAFLQKLANGDSGNIEWQSELSLSYERIGDVLDDAGGFSDALNAYHKAFAIDQQLSDHEPANDSKLTRVANAYRKIGNVLMQQDKPAEAQDAYNKSFAISQKVADSNSDIEKWQVNLSAAYDKLGDILLKNNKMDEALEDFREAFDVLQKLAQDKPNDSLLQNSVLIELDKIRRGVAATGPAR